MASVVDGNGGSRLVMTELGHVKELARQLEVHLGDSSPDICKHLASQISSITERSISLLITASSPHGARKRSAVVSPLSDASDAPFFKATKKRKTMDKKRHEVRMRSAGAGADHPADDGHSWRKYGQNEILGAKHPRGYYRCTHRHSQGCAATKQVQRTDEDPAFFDVVYLGDHTCVQSQRAAGQAAQNTQAPEHNDSPGGSSLLQSLSSSLTVKTEEQAMEPEQQLLGWDAPAPFCFSSTPATASRCLVPEGRPFSAPSTSDNWGVSRRSRTPTTSSLSRLSRSPCTGAAAAATTCSSGLMKSCQRSTEPTATGSSTTSRSTSQASSHDLSVMQLMNTRPREWESEANSSAMWPPLSFSAVWADMG